MQQAAPVSVLMSTFNRAPYIGQALDGLLGQSLPPAQVIVVDDGSTDGTAGILRGYGDRLAVLTQENAGKSVALNRALSHATGDFIWIFDDDDVPCPDALERHVAALDAAPEAGFTVSAAIRSETASDGTLNPIRPESLEGLTPETLYPRLLHACCVLQPGSLVRADAFRAVGPFREDLTRSLDYEFVLRLARCTPAVILPEPTFWMRLHDGSRGTARDAFGADEKALRWYRNDKIIFREVFTDVPLWQYLPHRPGDPPPPDFNRSLALMTRMSLFGDKGLWDEVIVDLRRMVVEGRFADLDDATLKPLLERMVGSAFAVRDLVSDRPALAEVTALVREAGSPFIRTVLARKLYHATVPARRAGDWTGVARITAAAVALGGMEAVAGVARNKLLGRPVLPNARAPG